MDAEAVAAKESTTPVFAATESPAILDFALAVMRLVAEECAKEADCEAAHWAYEPDQRGVAETVAAAIRKLAEGAE